MKALLLLLAAYGLGSIPFSYYLVRWLTGRDVRTLGSGNPGAANVLRIAGKGAGFAAFGLDAAKGAAAVALARSWGAGAGLVAAAAVAVVLGHLFPLLLGFRGGKGVATGAGAVGVLAPVAVGLAVLLFALLVISTRYVVIGSVAAALATAPLMLAAGRLGWAPPPPAATLGGAAAIALLITLRHHGNLARLRQGREPKALDPVE